MFTFPVSRKQNKTDEQKSLDNTREGDSDAGVRCFNGGCLSCNGIIQVEAGQWYTGTVWDTAAALHFRLLPCREGFL